MPSSAREPTSSSSWRDPGSRRTSADAVAAYVARRSALGRSWHRAPRSAARWPHGPRRPRVRDSWATPLLSPCTTACWWRPSRRSPAHSSPTSRAGAQRRWPPSGPACWLRRRLVVRDGTVDVRPGGNPGPRPGSRRAPQRRRRDLGPGRGRDRCRYRRAAGRVRAPQPAGGRPRRRAGGHAEGHRPRLGAAGPTGGDHGPVDRTPALRRARVERKVQPHGRRPQRRHHTRRQRGPRAPRSFTHCDLGIVGDWHEVVPLLTDALRRADVAPGAAAFG